MNIFEALREDHQTQRSLADILIKTSGDSDGRAEIFAKLKAELSAHAAAEERHFYVPLMRDDMTQEKARHSVAEHHELDLLVYATGFDAITGAFDQLDVRGAGGLTLAEKWKNGPSTYFGMLTHGFPNLLMVAGPQSVSGSTNFPRACSGLI